VIALLVDQRFNVPRLATIVAANVIMQLGWRRVFQQAEERACATARLHQTLLGKHVQCTTAGARCEIKDTVCRAIMSSSSVPIA
jgi:hypothetical protein